MAKVIKVVSFGLLLGGAAFSHASAQETGVGLPGGASSLSETHGSWTVQCRMVEREDSTSRLCAMLQRQTNSNGQQVIAIELHPNGDSLTGAIILPFGLAVTKPVSVRVDDREARDVAFSTCIPSGCVVPLAPDNAVVQSFDGSANIVVAAQNIDGKSVELTVPLTGFGPARTRIAELMK